MVNDKSAKADPVHLSESRAEPLVAATLSVAGFSWRRGLGSGYHDMGRYSK